MYGSPCNSPRIIALVNAYSASFPFITLFSFNVNWGVKGMALGIIFEGNEILDNRFFLASIRIRRDRCVIILVCC